MRRDTLRIFFCADTVLMKLFPADPSEDKIKAHRDGTIATDGAGD
jgi:hypothetical protein